MPPALLASMLALMATTTPISSPTTAPSPGDILATAPAGEWIDIAPQDMLVMTLAPDVKGMPRRVVIQLMPAPFSQGWIDNIRKLAKAHWFDGIAVVRVQDNYVVQWGDPDGEDPKKAKPLPAGIKAVTESYYRTPFPVAARTAAMARLPGKTARSDASSGYAFFSQGWPLAADVMMRKQLLDPRTGQPAPPPPDEPAWPTHCYGMVGVGRNLSPDTGSGAELYTVIGHAPRHLDRNIALVGRIIEGMEHLSSLPRGTGDLGFYKTVEERTLILSVRLASELPAARQPHLQYLSTESDSFTRYADARASRRDAFFITPSGGVDICNIPVPIRSRP